MFNIFLWVHESDIFVSDYSIDGADEFYSRVRSVEFFLQHLHDKFCSLWSLWMLAFAFVLCHSRIID